MQKILWGFPRDMESIKMPTKAQKGPVFRLQGGRLNRPDAPKKQKPDKGRLYAFVGLGGYLFTVTSTSATESSFSFFWSSS